VCSEHGVVIDIIVVLEHRQICRTLTVPHLDMSLRLNRRSMSSVRTKSLTNSSYLSLPFAVLSNQRNSLLMIKCDSLNITFMIYYGLTSKDKQIHKLTLWTKKSLAFSREIHQSY